MNTRKRWTWCCLFLVAASMGGAMFSHAVPARQEASAGWMARGNGTRMINSIGMPLQRIPRGFFVMGAPPMERGAEIDERPWQVMLTKDFFIGAHEVTQGQYVKIMGVNPSHFQGDELAVRDPESGEILLQLDHSQHPVEGVSWDDAVEFCRRLSALPEERAAGRVYRLPTEAEWEYACRAGGDTAYSFGDDPVLMDHHAWYLDNSDNRTRRVGRKRPNAWGLHDMHGNVWEWCSDWYGDYPQNPTIDPIGPLFGSFRVLRGGRWNHPPVLCRSASRFGYQPTVRCNHVGFRVCFSVPD